MKYVAEYSYNISIAITYLTKRITYILMCQDLALDYVISTYENFLIHHACGPCGLCINASIFKAQIHS